MPRRRLTPEERTLWRQVADTATPRRVENPLVPLDPEPEPVRRIAVARPSQPPLILPAKPKPLPGRVSLDLVADPHAALARAQPHMDRRRFEKLRRGRLDPEARLDLHGMTSQRAHGALNAFVQAAHAGGLRLVLVITGKGRTGGLDTMAPHRQGILRHNVPHWLETPPLAAKVLQVAPAHLRHGGGGAYYVYLRRQR